jgi:hypothetical protein
VLGITGPTLVHGNGGQLPGGNDDDTINVTAMTAQDYATELNVDADTGSNALHVMEPGSTPDTFTVMQGRIESGLLHAVNFTAKDGDYTAGVSLTTGSSSDTVNVRNTLPNVHTTIKTGGADDVVNVSSQSPVLTGGLPGILGILSIDLEGGAKNALTISNSGAAAGNQNVLIRP